MGIQSSKMVDFSKKHAMIYTIVIMANLGYTAKQKAKRWAWYEIISLLTHRQVLPVYHDDLLHDYYRITAHSWESGLTWGPT